MNTELLHVTNDFSDYHYPAANSAAPASISSQRQILIRSLVVLGVVVLIGIGGAYFIVSQFPNAMRNVLIAVDRFGLTDVGETEQVRVRKIMRLPITYEEKQVLVNRTVFFGAAPEMVELALGTPVCQAHAAATDDQPTTLLWVYFMEADHKPTILSFQSEKLVAAYKGSLLDVCKQ